MLCWLLHAECQMRRTITPSLITLAGNTPGECCFAFHVNCIMLDAPISHAPIDYEPFSPPHKSDCLMDILLTTKAGKWLMHDLPD
jgi:hypothetical protein